MDKVELWYDVEYDEWSRLDRHKIEFDVTKYYLDKYITNDNQDIFDIGGGPGRYSFYLTAKGHNVSLLDLSSRNIEVAKIKSKELNLELNNYIHGNALSLPTFEEQFDVVLLMGPLYHLVSAKDRCKALEEALKVLKPNGIIIASFISNYAPIQDNILNLYEIESTKELLDYLKDGINPEDAGFTTAYFTSHEEARSLMKSFNLNELVFAGVENILGSREKDINKLPETEYQKWLELAINLSVDPNLFGTSQHYLYIGRKEY